MPPCINWRVNEVLHVFLSVCLSVYLSVYMHLVRSLRSHCDTVRDIYLFAKKKLTIHLLLSKSDSRLSLHAGRSESAEASHFDGGNCHCHIWNLLGV